MPTLQKLADRGLTYSQWHTTALCSPTRSTFLTGRNHHLNASSCITEGAQGFPGWSGRLPAECATSAQVLQETGWSTFWLGKNHNVPEQDIAAGASRSEWPLSKGFDRYYGFLGGETNQWYPDLVEDNRSSTSPTAPKRATTSRRISSTTPCK
jgi:arylsulfatase